MSKLSTTRYSTSGYCLSDYRVMILQMIKHGFPLECGDQVPYGVANAVVQASSAVTTSKPAMTLLQSKGCFLVKCTCRVSVNSAVHHNTARQIIIYLTSSMTLLPWDKLVFSMCLVYLNNDDSCTISRVSFVILQLIRGCTSIFFKVYQPTKLCQQLKLNLPSNAKTVELNN